MKPEIDNIINSNVSHEAATSTYSRQPKEAYMSSNNTIYSLIEKFSDVNVPIASGKEFPVFEIELDDEKGTFYKSWPPSWGRVYTPEMRKEISKRNKERNINFITNGATEAARQANLGIKRSNECKEKMAARKRKPVIINGIEYPSKKHAEEIIGQRIDNWFRLGKAHWKQSG